MWRDTRHRVCDGVGLHVLVDDAVLDITDVVVCVVVDVDDLAWLALVAFVRLLCEMRWSRRVDPRVHREARDAPAVSRAP